MSEKISLPQYLFLIRTVTKTNEKMSNVKPVKTQKSLHKRISITVAEIIYCSTSLFSL